jgi:myosin heavy subunit
MCTEMEQREYTTERIDVAHVSYVDNQPCLDLIESGKASVLAMADEELKLPGGNDDNLLARMHAAFATNKYYIKPKTAVPVFTIAHYAGPVEVSTARRTVARWRSNSIVV